MCYHETAELKGASSDYLWPMDKLGTRRMEPPRSELNNEPPPVRLRRPAPGERPQVPNIFSDHMVLQAGKPVPIWGTAEAGSSVTVTFGDQKQTVSAGKDGRWRVTLNPLAASAGPRRLAVAAEAHGRKAEVVFEDILVGEVCRAEPDSSPIRVGGGPRSKPVQPRRSAGDAVLQSYRRTRRSQP